MFGNTPAVGGTSLFGQTPATQTFGTKPTGFFYVFIIIHRVIQWMFILTLFFVGFGTFGTSSTAPVGGLFGSNNQMGTGMFGQPSTATASNTGLFGNTSSMNNTFFV